jgi:hypothetical protein
MVQFMTSYFNAMDREFEERPVSPTESVSAPDIEQPLIPISQIGATSIDVGQGNILQELEKNIHMGASKIQIIFSAGGSRAGGISSGPSSYGKDVRKALQEKAKSTGVDIIGVELSPGQISGLAGFDPQSGRLSEQKRAADMNKVRDAIRFAADVSKGGGVDLWSQEFSRSVIDADWNKKKEFFGHTPAELKDEKEAKMQKYLLDKRTGDPVRESVVNTDDKITLPRYRTARDMRLAGKPDRKGRVLALNDFVDIEGNYVNPDEENAYARLVPLMDKKGQLEVDHLNWDDIKIRTAEFNRRNNRSGDDELKPEEWFYRQKLLTQLAQARGHVSFYGYNLDEMYNRLEDMRKQRDFVKGFEDSLEPTARREWIIQNIIREEGASNTERERLLSMKPSEAMQARIERYNEHIRGQQEQTLSAKMQLRQIEDLATNVVTPQHFAKEKTFDSYAELGVDALRVTKERKLERPIYIGPEIGWAGDGYGGHPEEFIELIKKSREKMAEKLVAQGYTKDAAVEASKNHIQGMLDTSHLAMWYKHYARKDGETDEEHLKRFNNWMKEETVRMVKEGVVGGVQVVDSITGEHAHLPAGQGSFDVAGLVMEMKKVGFDGHIIAEGHEEDTAGFGQGRILTETWRAFGAPVRSVTPGEPMGLGAWGGMHRSYFSHLNPTTYIIGAYVPSNDWQPWSEVGFD